MYLPEPEVYEEYSFYEDLKYLFTTYLISLFS